MSHNKVCRRDMLKTTGLSGLFALIPSSFLPSEQKLPLQTLPKDPNVVFGTGVKKRLVNLVNGFKPWLHECSNLDMNTTWCNNWTASHFKRGNLCEVPDDKMLTTLNLWYPNYTLEFQSYNINKRLSVCDNILHDAKSYNAIDAYRNYSDYDMYVRFKELIDQNEPEQMLFIQLSNVKLVSCVYMKDCQVEHSVSYITTVW